MSRDPHCAELYVLGPPVQTRDELSALLEKVLQVILQAEVRNVRSHTIAGPVTYMSQWLLQGGRQREHRSSLDYMDLWFVSVSWSGSALCSSSTFSLLITDRSFYGLPQWNRSFASPAFETFAVISKGDSKASDRIVMEWLTNDAAWGLREKWMRAVGSVEAEARDMKASMAELCKPPWKALLDLQSMFPTQHSWGTQYPGSRYS